VSGLQTTGHCSALDVLEGGDCITSINGASTVDKDKTFIERVKHNKCHNDVLILRVRKPAKQQEFNLWDLIPVKLDIKEGLKNLPFSLDIFYTVIKILLYSISE